MLVLTTSLGTIRIELLDELAPVTAAHVRRLVTEHSLGIGKFYRAQRVEHVVPGREFEVVQGGWPELEQTLPRVPHEAGRIPHSLGTVSLGRFEPGTASSEFFVCLSESAPALDPGAPAPMDGHGFAVFGRVVDGLDVLRAIHQLPTTDDAPHPLVRGQILADPVPFEAALS
jgi:peptidyl-prolyl cis-trans isomerase A (cyclophilin A)